YKEVGRVQGGNVGWGDSRVAEYGAIAIGLTLLPAGATVLVESDLEELVQALHGERVPKGEVEAYFAIIRATIQAKGLTVTARKASRESVEAAHVLANGGREELAQKGPLVDLLRMVKVGGRAFVFEALRSLPAPEAEITGGTWEAARLRYLREQAPQLFTEAWKEAKRMKDRQAEAFAEELLLASMRGKPPTEEQARFLKSLGREVPKDRAEAYLLIRQVKRRRASGGT
ncbi:reverse transcriptase-like protein, partial [Fervidobacterium sp.]